MINFLSLSSENISYPQKFNLETLKQKRKFSEISLNDDNNVTAKKAVAEFSKKIDQELVVVKQIPNTPGFGLFIKPTISKVLEAGELLAILPGEKYLGLSGSRCINHSSDFSNAAPFFKTMPNGGTHALIKLTKRVFPGEQVLIAYDGKEWKKKGEIPPKLTPFTYLLRKSGGVEGPFTDLQTLTEKALVYLSQNRRPLSRDDDHILKDLRRIKLPSAYPETIEKIQRFRQEVWERGIPSHFDFRETSQGKWGVFDAHMIKKEAFIGVFSGTVEIDPLEGHENEMSKYFFKVNPKTKHNFTKHIHQSVQANVRAEAALVFDKIPQILLIAKKNIYPGQQLFRDAPQQALPNISPKFYNSAHDDIAQ
jgi:hypothetical protein